MSKEAIALLEKANTYCLRLNAISICGKISCNNGDIYNIRRELDQALTILKQQPAPRDFSKTALSRLPIFLPDHYEGMKSLCATLTDTIKEACKILDGFEQQPAAGEFTKEIREELSELLPLPGSNQLKCSQCGGLVEYNTILTYDAQSHCEKKDGGQMMGIGWAGWLNMMRDFIRFKVPKLCDRLDSAEAINKDLLEACECIKSSIEQGLIWGKGEDPEIERSMILALIEAAIAKAKQ